ncbi:hypothetical protein E4U17_003167 [Claviceps sp. LM77 group G4]|nr:hypothetical protein E4U17_003167 [Claviceps sp. LM77 group G4]KAG6073013.1 hypothetical protein E4U33_003073 [Claviceps sp. LM78 group G4]KAG6075472.1 hypothetical protein E4U16_003347 [Claviceps sp. LM84 group G4]
MKPSNGKRRKRLNWEKALRGHKFMLKRNFYDPAGNASKSNNGKSIPRRRDAADATTMRLFFRVADSQEEWLKS